MEKNEENPASDEFVAEKVSDLVVMFYDTPESFFKALAKLIIYHRFTEEEVSQMINNAIYKIKKTKLTIADVFNGKEEIYPYSRKL